MTTFTRQVTDTLLLSDRVVVHGAWERLTTELAFVDGETGARRVTTNFAFVDGETGARRLTTLVAFVDAYTGVQRVSQEFVNVDGATGAPFVSQEFANIDGATGMPVVSQEFVNVDITSGDYHSGVIDRLGLYDTVVATRIQPPVIVNLIRVTDTLGVQDQLPARGPAGAPTRDAIFTEPLGIYDSNFPLMRHTIKWWQRLYVQDTVVATHIIAEEGPPPTEVSTTHLRQATDTLDLYDSWLDFVNGARLRRVRDTLRVWDRWLRPRNYSYAITDYLTLADSQDCMGNVWYAGRGLVELGGQAETWRDIAVEGVGLVELLGAATTWRDYAASGLGVLDLLGTAVYRKVELTVTGVPDGYAARVTLPDATVAAAAPSSMGRVVLELSVPDTATSGTLQVFQNSAMTVPAPSGLIPLTGFGTFKRTNVWGYRAAPHWLSDTARSVYIERPRGGWTAPGSARVDREETGFTTFTDSTLGGLSRGDHDTLATSHGGPPPNLAVRVKSGGGLLDITSYLAYTNSFAWLQDSMPIFANSHDELYIGASSRFSAAHFWLARNGTERLRLTPYYSAGGSAWVAWTGSSMILPIDTTSGFTWSGYAGLEPCGDWEAMPLLDATSRFWFRLVRETGSRDLVVPRLMGVTLTADTIITRRLTQPYLYYLTAQDSGQTIYFKAMAHGLLGTTVEGVHAPVAAVNLT